MILHIICLFLGMLSVNLYIFIRNKWREYQIEQDRVDDEKLKKESDQFIKDYCAKFGGEDWLSSMIEADQYEINNAMTPLGNHGITKEPARWKNVKASSSRSTKS